MIAAVVVAALIVLPGPSGATQDPFVLYSAGVQAFRSGDLVGAARALEHALVEVPDYVPARFVLAQVYHGLFEQTGLFYHEAVEGYETVAQSLGDLKPDHPRRLALFLLGQLLVRGGEYRKALGPLREFLSSQPEYHWREEVWNCIGVAHYYLNEYEEAVRAFKSALDADPAFSPARFNLRSVFTRLSLFDMAMVNRRLGRLDLALIDIERLLDLAPRYLAAHVQRVLILRDLQRDGEARAAALRALSLGSDPKVSFELHEVLGDILSGQGKTAVALKHYRQCLQIFPGYLQVVEKIDRLEQESGGPEDERDVPEVPRPPRRTAPLTEFPM